MNSEVKKLTDLVPDAQNANRGTPRGTDMLERSLQSYGAGRSILVDKHGNVIAGNKTLEASVGIGLKDALVVHTKGEQLVVVQRDDLDLNTDVSAKELAVSDNRTGELDLSWDADMLRKLEEDGAELSKFFTTDETAALLRDAEALADDTETIADVDVLKSQYQVLITCQTEQDQVALLERFAQEGISCRALVS